VRTIIAAAIALALAACTDDRADRPLREANAWSLSTATPLGPPVSCIQQARVTGRTPRDDRTIDFQLDDGSVMRNRLPYSCPGLLRTTRFTYRTALDRLCSVDIITLVQPDGTPGPSCGLGLFQPVAVPPRQGPLPGAN
jgi:hypothetical protein